MSEFERAEFEILPSGEIRMMYDDLRSKQVADLLGASIVEVQRASHVEWEKVGEESGWTVRAAHDPELAIRRHANGQVLALKGPLAVFPTREAALASERLHFWDLIPRTEVKE